MTYLFLLIFLLFIKVSRCKEKNKSVNESYRYSYIINDEISDFVPFQGLKVKKYIADDLPIGIYLNPKTGYFFGRPQQACKSNVTVYVHSDADVIKKNIIIQGMYFIFPFI